MHHTSPLAFLNDTGEETARTGSGRLETRDDYARPRKRSVAPSGIDDGGWMTIVTERAEIEARAKVTERIRPLVIDGRTVHQVALPWHWGYGGPVTGDAANDLIALSGDPNVTIEESKAFTCDVRAGRRARQPTEPLRDAHEHRHVSPSEDHPAESPKEPA